CLHIRLARPAGRAIGRNSSRKLSQALCQRAKSCKIRCLNKKPRPNDRGTIAGRATIAGRNLRFSLGRLRRRWMEGQRQTVHAVTQAGRLRTVVKDVAEMAAAAAAMHFGAQHAKGAVRGGADRVLERLIETRPAGAALELGLRREQRQVAAGAGEDALTVLLQQRAGAWPLGALVAQYLVLLRRQLRAPFGIGLLDLELLGGLGRRNLQPAEGRKGEQAGDRGKQDAAVNHDGLRDCSPGITEVSSLRYTGSRRLFSTKRERGELRSPCLSHDRPESAAPDGHAAAGGFGPDRAAAQQAAAE